LCCSQAHVENVVQEWERRILCSGSGGYQLPSVASAIGWEREESDEARIRGSCHPSPTYGGHECGKLNYFQVCWFLWKK
jgi:hypothetical protein